VKPDLRDFGGVEQPKLLSKCYDACLDGVNAHDDIESIAFCGISTGVYRYGKESACKVAMKTVFDWIIVKRTICDCSFFIIIH
jgi:O-acetyl-ADP-ribose deacetylase (regulator of RNase III)